MVNTIIRFSPQKASIQNQAVKRNNSFWLLSFFMVFGLGVSILSHHLGKSEGMTLARIACVQKY